MCSQFPRFGHGFLTWGRGARGHLTVIETESRFKIGGREEEGERETPAGPISDELIEFRPKTQERDKHAWTIYDG